MDTTNKDKAMINPHTDAAQVYALLYVGDQVAELVEVLKSQLLVNHVQAPV